MTDKQLIRRVGKKGKTASEVGTNLDRLRKLEQQGAVAQIGTRQTGQRGRPAVVFARAA